jgi:hypothetical protein
MMIGSAALVFISTQMLLQGRSFLGRFWIVGVVFGLFLLALSFLGWRQGRDEETTAALRKRRRHATVPVSATRLQVNYVNDWHIGK